MTKLIFTEEDLQYFTGFPLSGFLILKDGKRYLYAGDEDLARKANVSFIKKSKEKDHFFKTLKKMRINSVDIDFSKLTHDMFVRFSKHKIKLNDISLQLSKQMAVKKPSELSKIKTACSIADEALELMRDSIKVGVTEQKVAAIGQRYLEKCEAVSFPFIVESGENTMFTHFPPTSKKIKQNEMIICDIGFKYQGYCSDVTRTFCIKPDNEKQKLYNLINSAQSTAFNACKPNSSAALPAKAVEKLFKKNNVDKYWKYSLGHGIGLHIHEYPSLYTKSKDKLFKNSVFTLEPGLHIPKIGGCRIEDDILMLNKPVYLSKFEKVLEC